MGPTSTPQMRAARNAALEFLQRLDEPESAYAELDDLRSPGGFLIYSATKQTGAVRRQSMELTRALAELRKTGGLTNV